MDDRFAIDDLIAPLSDGAGPDLRAGGPGSEPYLMLKDWRADARRAERDAVQSGDAEADPLRAGIKAWAEIATVAPELLASRSKDLQVGVWLCEAWLRTDGFDGLAAGITLLAGLVETWWDEGLHPGEDEDGEETRVTPLIGLFGRGEPGTLVEAIKLLPLTDHGTRPLALWTVETVRAQTARHDDPEIRDQLAERRRERIEEVDQAIARASPAFAAAAVGAIENAMAAIERLMAAIDSNTGLGRFGSQVMRPLEDALALLLEHHSEMGEAKKKPVPAETEPDIGATTTVAPAVAEQPAPMDREAALATLLEVAAFFERNEPQSVVGQSLRDVVRRANLPLEALLTELLPEGDQRKMFLLRAGIRGEPQDDQSSSY